MLQGLPVIYQPTQQLFGEDLPTPQARFFICACNCVVQFAPWLFKFSSASILSITTNVRSLGFRRRAAECLVKAVYRRVVEV